MAFEKYGQFRHVQESEVKRTDNAVSALFTVSAYWTGPQRNSEGIPDMENIQ